MRHVVVAGGAGYIGSYLIYELHRQYPDLEITAIDIKSPSASPPTLVAESVKLYV